MRVRAAWSPVAPIALAYGLVMASSYVLKAVRNALFLERQGVRQLPLATLVVAGAGALVGVLYARLSGRFRADRLVRGSILAFVACLVGFRLALPVGGAWLVYGFYVWVSLFGLVATSLVWLLANAAFDAREARGSFGIIGTAGITGAVVGGLGTRFVVGALGGENLLIVCVAMLGACVPLLGRVRPLPVHAPRRMPATRRGGLGTIARSELLAGVALVTLVGAAVSVVVDIQFNDAVAQAMPDQNAKTAFFGTFLAALSLAALAFQVLVTPRLLAIRGVGAALMLLPLALVVGSAAMWFVPGLWAAIVAKGGDGALRHSVHKSASEIVLVPVPEELKQKAKLTLDASVSTLGEGLGALLVLLVTGVAGLPHRALSLVSLGLLALWLFLGRRVRHAYLGAFRRALERREIDPSELRTDVGDASTLAQVTAHLGSEHERHVAYALDLLAGTRDQALAPTVLPLVDHASADVRRRALRVLVSLGVELPSSRRDRLLRDDDAAVRLETLRLDAAALSAEPAGLDALLRHGEARVQATALDFLAQDGTEVQRALVDEALLVSLLERRDADAELLRAMVARVLGVLDAPEHRRLLRRLTEDSSPSIVREVIRSAGLARDRELFGWLLERLGDARTRREARAALAAFGPDGLPALEAALADPATPRVLAGHLARVVAEVGGSESVTLLLGRLVDSDSGRDVAVVKALSKLRAADPLLRFPADVVERHVLKVVAALDELERQRAGIADSPGSPRIALLRRAVVEKCSSLREQALRLLGLCYPPKDMLNAFHGLVGEDRARRAHALEFLDNVLTPRVKAVLVPALERGGAAGRAESPRRLLESRDGWLRACAVANVRTLAPDEVGTWVEKARADRDPLVRDAAEGV